MKKTSESNIRQTSDRIPHVAVSDWQWSHPNDYLICDEMNTLPKQISTKKKSDGLFCAQKVCKIPKSSLTDCQWDDLDSTLLKNTLEMSCKEFEKTDDLDSTLLQNTLEMSRKEFEKTQQIDVKVAHEMDFQQFCTQYKHEVKEKYLLNQIATALQKITSNKNVCDYLIKHIDACNWAKNDIELNPDVLKEFDQHMKVLSTQCNSHLECATMDWESLRVCLRHLSKTDLVAIRQMLFQ